MTAPARQGVESVCKGQGQTECTGEGGRVGLGVAEAHGGVMFAELWAWIPAFSCSRFTTALSKPSGLSSGLRFQRELCQAEAHTLLRLFPTTHESLLVILWSSLWGSRGHFWVLKWLFSLSHSCTISALLSSLCC